MKMHSNHHLGKKTVLACIIALSSVGYANASSSHAQNLTQYPPKALLAQITAPVTGELYKTKLTSEQQQIVDQAKLEKKNGWWHVGIKGDAFNRGFQYGYLIAPDFKLAWKDSWSMTYLTTGVPYSSWQKAALEQTKGKIPAELRQEMEGIAKGLNAAGLHVTLADIITWNDMIELTGYWWPSVGMHNYTKWVDPGLINTSVFPAPYTKAEMNTNNELSKNSANIEGAKGNCSAFIATGKSTDNKGIVIGHETFNDFWSGQFSNVILNIIPIWKINWSGG